MVTRHTRGMLYQVSLYIKQHVALVEQLNLALHECAALGTHPDNDWKVRKARTAIAEHTIRFHRDFVEARYPGLSTWHFSCVYFMSRDEKVRAIKELRSQTMMGLKDAKDVIDNLQLAMVRAHMCPKPSYWNDGEMLVSDLKNRHGYGEYQDTVLLEDVLAALELAAGL